MMVRYPYIRSYRDRHGRTRVEFRRNGKTIPMKATPGTPEFQQAYEEAKALLEGGRPNTVKLPSIKTGTLRWLCVEYFKSVEFGQLSDSTRHMRRLLLEAMLLEPSSPGSAFLFGDYPASRMEAKHVKVLRDRKRTHPDAANHRIKALRGLFKWAIESDNKGGVMLNPTRDVPKLKAKPGGYHAWSEDEREQFEARHPVGTTARLAYALLFHTGQRRSDVVAFGRRHVKNGKLCFTQHKSRARKPISLELPILPELQRILDTTPLGDLTFLVNEKGQPFEAADFTNWFRERCDQAGLPHCSAHGLRKAAATVAAENGATSHQLMSIFGWLSLAEAERYTRSAERSGLAERGMGLLVPIKPRTSSV